MNLERRYRALLGAAGIVLVTLMLGSGSLAQQVEDEAIVPADVFIGHFWSQIKPDYSYLAGCTTGYRSFYFSETGYFLFDNRVHGSWRVDRLGNLVLRTKAGQQLTLSYNRDITLMPIVQTNQLTNQPANTAAGAFYFRRTDLFQKCTD